MKRVLVPAAALILLALPPTVFAGETLTYADLVRRLVDPSHLAVLPAPGESAAQWSSYDRASRHDAATGKYVAWDANGDGQGRIREEAGRTVMAEMTGPGCLTRIWSAAAEAGHVRIYLDGQDVPAVDLPFRDYFDGKHAPFAYPGLSYNLADDGCSGQNLFVPIPYRKSCKVVADEGWGNYFHFDYVTYPAGTKVPTFSAALAREHEADLRAVDTFFRTKLGTNPNGAVAGQETATHALTIAPGETARVARLDGPRAITGLKVRMRFAGREDETAALRRLALRITWDGQATPAVWCPLGDVFGTAPGVNPYRTLLTGMTDDGFYAYWFMPFGKSAVVELANEDDTARAVAVELSHAPLGRPFAGLGHFHLKWHRDTTEPPADRRPDWELLRTSGRGRFCGVMLHVWNPRGGWWGEGDEKFFVDGEPFPSTFGTGSEDYFGYAWCHPGRFEKAFHAQSMTQQNRGHQAVLRWQVADNVPFHQSFEGAIEKYYGNDRGTLYACAVAWYLDPEGADPYGPVPVASRHGYYARPDLVVVGMHVLNEPGGEVQLQRLADRGVGRWKNDEQLWWTGARPGDRLVLEVPVATAGRYALAVHLTRARDYGVVRLALDGAPLGGPIDLYDPAVVPSGPIALGTHELAAGRHALSVEIVGANPAAVKAYMFGIDRIALTPAP